MAGMLPGVESARRRRFHQSTTSELTPATFGSTRRSSFCLYASSHDYLLTSTSSTQRNQISQVGAECDESSLGSAAREAKKRLDERLWRSQTKRTVSNQERLRSCPTVEGKELVKRSGSKKVKWLKLSWKACEQEECAVCLDELKTTETIMQLPCAHKFHTNCLVPWLEGNAHCPCCRTHIPSSSSSSNYL